MVGYTRFPDKILLCLMLLFNVAPTAYVIMATLRLVLAEATTGPSHRTISGTDWYQVRTTYLPQVNWIASSPEIIRYPQWKSNLQGRGISDWKSTSLATQPRMSCPTNIETKLIKCMWHSYLRREQCVTYTNGFQWNIV